MALTISIICTLISFVIIYFALKVLDDSRKMKKKNEEEEKSLGL